MFEAKSALFIYCVSPVHMGAGTALGVVDNPIQREVHTGHPTMAGSGLKGAFRDVYEARNGKEAANKVFGPAGEGTQASDHAGAISFADAQLVAFPVRSLARAFVYATCPTALARLQRLLALAGVEGAAEWAVPRVNDDGCAVAEGFQGAPDGKLILEAFRFDAKPDPAVGAVAGWLAEHAIPGGEAHAYFRDKLGTDLVVLSDERFAHFVRHATLVEPHVRINDETGTAHDGGLFYTENLPPESLLVSLAMASKERVKKGDSKAAEPAEEILASVQDALDGELVQVGGDATTGRGQVVLRFVKGGA